jgi:hypothetical protein
LLQDELIKSFEILDFKSGNSFYFLKIRAVVIDESLLHIKEYSSLDGYLSLAGKRWIFEDTVGQFTP